MSIGSLSHWVYHIECTYIKLYNTDPTLIMEAFHRPLVCHLSSKVICPCVDGPNSIGRNHMLKVMKVIFLKTNFKKEFKSLIHTFFRNIIKHWLIWFKKKAMTSTTTLQLLYNLDWKTWNCPKIMSTFLAFTNLSCLICLFYPLIVFIQAKNFKLYVSKK